MFEKKWIKIKKKSCVSCFVRSLLPMLQHPLPLWQQRLSILSLWSISRFWRKLVFCLQDVHSLYIRRARIGKAWCFFFFFFFLIKKFCINLMKDLNKIVEVDPTVDFWDNFPKLEWRNTRFGDLREMIEDYFVKYFIKKFIYDKNEFQLLLLQLERLF